jgi:hypothetical protein
MCLEVRMSLRKLERRFESVSVKVKVNFTDFDHVHDTIMCLRKLKDLRMCFKVRMCLRKFEKGSDIFS